MAMSSGMVPHEYFVGLLSGTSIDGVDAVVVDFASEPPRLVATHSEPVPEELRSSIMRLCSQEPVTLVLLGQTDVALGRLFAKAVKQLLQKASLSSTDMLAIGSHGQTVMHHPHGENRFTLQIGDPNTIAYLTKISTIADFRRKDMAAGGQGAPLAPLFHQDFFGHCGKRRAVLNVGGIANITLLQSDLQTSIVGFDTGPGNVLMDSWIRLKRNLPYDHSGNWAKCGEVSAELLNALLLEPYLGLPAPKSTGRELFNMAWLQDKLRDFGTLRDEDVQASLLAFTARSIAESVDWRAKGIEEIVVCGGGAHNSALMAALEQLIPLASVISSEQAGLAPDWVEGVAFAWMARKAWMGEAIATGSVTGASRACILGGIYENEAPEDGNLH
jgi:anhydro-N-acetylmuramic acid kinase